MYRLDVKIRLHNGADIAMGPGKAELLAAIAEHGDREYVSSDGMWVGHLCECAR